MDVSTATPSELDATTLGNRLSVEVLDPLKRSFVGKDEIVDLMGIALVAGENLFLLGPPGTAKSALIYELGRRIQGRTFEYLLTRFTEPNELFGPFDIRRLREGDLITNTEGMLPEASLVFLDELLNANSAILNSLRTSRGREPLLIVIWPLFRFQSFQENQGPRPFQFPRVPFNFPFIHLYRATSFSWLDQITIVFLEVGQAYLQATRTLYKSPAVILNNSDIAISSVYVCPLATILVAWETGCLSSDWTGSPLLSVTSTKYAYSALMSASQSSVE